MTDFSYAISIKKKIMINTMETFIIYFMEYLYSKKVINDFTYLKF